MFLLVLGVSGPAAPAALGATTIHVDTSVRGAYVELPGAAYGVDGATSGSLHGAIAFKDTGTGRFFGTLSYADTRGTLRGTGSGTQEPPTGTTIAFSDRLTVTQATRRYRGPRGRLVANGTADTPSGFVTEKIARTLRHGRPSAAASPGPSRSSETGNPTAASS